METTRAKPKSGFYIEVTCPGCGGSLDLNEDFFVLSCDHCGCVHRIIMPDTPAAYLIPSRIDKREARFSIDRFLKSRNLPLSGSSMHLKKFYYPYWRVNAVLFRVRNKVYERVVAEESEYQDAIVVTKDRTEISLSPYSATRAAGMPFDGIPSSVGLRTEYIKLIPYAREAVEEEFDSYPVLTSWEDMRANLLLNVGIISDIDEADYGSNITELFHPRASLVYFPYLVFESYTRGNFNRYVVDGVSGRVVNHVYEIDSESQFEYPEAPTLDFGALKVEHHRCGTCGVDLPPQQSYVYVCRNCHELTVLGDHGLTMKELLCAVADDKPEDRMLPFWSMKVRPKDATRLRTLVGGIHNSDRLVIPAFKTQNFEAVVRLAKRMSAAIVRIDLSPREVLNDRFLPVGVSIEDALMLAEIIIHRQLYSKTNNVRTGEATFTPEEISLVYLPFHPEHYFYVDSVMNTITFERSLVP